MTKVQCAFQGGGAKLGALLAASSQQKALNYTISRVSVVKTIIAATTPSEPHEFSQGHASGGVSIDLGALY